MLHLASSSSNVTHHTGGSHALPQMISRPKLHGSPYRPGGGEGPGEGGGEGPAEGGGGDATSPAGVTVPSSLHWPSTVWHSFLIASHGGTSPKPKNRHEHSGCSGQAGSVVEPTAPPPST